MNKHQVNIVFDDESNEFIATCSHYPYLSGIGEDQVTALDLLNDAIQMGLKLINETSIIDMTTTPILINSWDELRDISIESEFATLEVDTHSGRIRYKEHGCKYNGGRFGDYLSPNAFFSMDYQYYTKLLRDAGFNIQLNNWHGETIPYKEVVKERTEQ